MKTILFFGFTIISFTSFCAEECSFVQGFPVVIDTKTCRPEGTKFCRAKVKCGENIADYICPSNGPFSCPSVQECISNNKHNPSEAITSDDQVNSTEEREQKALSKSLGSPRNQVTSSQTRTQQDSNITLQLSTSSSGNSGFRSTGGSSSGGGSINKEHTSDEIQNRTYKGKIDLVKLLSGEESSKTIYEIESFLNKKSLLDDAFYIEITILKKSYLFLVQKKKNEFRLLKDRWNSQILETLVDEIDRQNVISADIDSAFAIADYLTTRLELTF